LIIKNIIIFNVETLLDGVGHNPLFHSYTKSRQVFDNLQTKAQIIEQNIIYIEKIEDLQMAI